MHFEDAHRLGADIAEEQVSVVVHRSAGDVLRRLSRVVQHRDFLPLQGGGFSRQTTPSRSGPSAGIGLYTGSRQREAT